MSSSQAASASGVPDGRSPGGAAGGAAPRAADWHGIFASLPVERDYEVEDVEGRLPDELRGTLYRNGPGKLDVAGRPFAHLFDGDGMLSQFTIQAGRLRYRNRYVRTNHFLGEIGATLPRFRRFGQQRPGGPVGNAFRTKFNPANTSVVLLAGKLLALWEGGRPWQLDPDTLETLGEWDFDGQLPPSRWFSAHPKLDPRTGEVFNFGLQYGVTTKLRCYRIDRAGRLHDLPPVTLPYPVSNHDFALTDRHLVFVLDPLLIRFLPYLLGRVSLAEAIVFDPTKATRFVLVPRDGGPPRVAEGEPFVQYHIGHAFEQGSDTVVDLVRNDDYAADRSLRSFSTAPFFSGRLTRMRVTRDGRVEVRELCDWEGEFPQHDQRRTGLPYRYSYLAGSRTEQFQTAVLKLDHETGRRWAHDFGAGEVTSEAIFVPRAHDAAEDDGWLLSVVYSAATQRSRLVVLDARDVEGEPLAQAHLDHHVPFGFHGTFTPRVAPIVAGP